MTAKTILDGLFHDRRPVVHSDGMQMFRHRSEAGHTYAILLALLLGRAGRTVREFSLPLTTLSGLLAQTAEVGKSPLQWHIEHIDWFRLQADQSGTEFITECRLVVDAWVEEREPPATVPPTPSMAGICLYDPSRVSREELMKVTGFGRYVLVPFRYAVHGTVSPPIQFCPRPPEATP